MEIDITSGTIDVCTSMPSITGDSDTRLEFTEITPQLLSGRGKGGGKNLLASQGGIIATRDSNGSIA